MIVHLKIKFIVNDQLGPFITYNSRHSKHFFCFIVIMVVT